ncbi:MFS transporter [Streptantibioticus rubrisoli]
MRNRKLRNLLPETRVARLLAVGTLIDSVGFGLYVTGSVVFFTRSVGLSAGQVGIGLSVAGVTGLLAAVPLGHLADRKGPREVAIGLALAQTALMACYALVHSFPGFLVVASLFSAAERGSQAVRAALLAGVVDSASRVKVQAYLRSVFNVGISAGTLAASTALQADSRSLYLALIFGNSLSFLLLASTTAMLPRTTTAPKTAAKRGPGVLSDWPYLSLGILNGLLGVNSTVLMVGIPVWISLHTGAPRALISLLFFANTVLTVLLQVRVSRGSEDVATAARALAISGVATGAACLLLAPAAWLTPVWATAVLIAATLALTYGELLSSAGGWGISFGLARADAQGSYQGGFTVGFAGRDIIGPFLVVSVAVGHGTLGWSELCVLFLALGATVPVTTRWALRRAAQVPAEALPEGPATKL